MKKPTCKLSPKLALQAIAARIQGVYDDPALMLIGTLSADTKADILYIIHMTTEITK